MDTTTLIGAGGAALLLAALAITRACIRAMEEWEKAIKS
jgi:hypothetical protein